MNDFNCNILLTVFCCHLIMHALRRELTRQCTHHGNQYKDKLYV
jgi:hypothetical protein